MTSIGEYVFSGCSNLTSITISDSVTSIGRWAFDGCTNLTTINFNGTMAKWKSISKNVYWNENTGDYIVILNDGTKLDKNGNVIE